MSLRKQTVHGIAWQGFSQVSGQALQTIINIVLARILVPADFGLIGMVSVVTSFIVIINRLGLTGTIVYKRDIEERHLSSIYWFSQLEGLVLFGLAILAAPYVAHFYNQPNLRLIFIYLSFGFVLSSLTSVHLSLLDRNMRFKKMILPGLLQIVVAGSITIFLATRGLGVWSLVWGSLIGTAFGVLMYWRISDWWPKLIFDLRSVGEVLGYGIKVMAQQTINYLGSNVDFFLTGKILGAASLGFYNMAFNLTTYPQRNFIQLVNRVTFPSFSKVQEDHQKLRQGYLELTKYLSLITYPFIFGLFAVAPEFIKVIYTAKWSPAIVPLQILCLGSIFSLTSSPTGSIFLAKGKAGFAAKLGLVRFLLLASAVYVGSRFGIVGVAVGVSIFFTLFNSVFILLAIRMIELSLSELLRSIGPPILSSLIMVGAIFGLRFANIYLKLADKWLLIILVGFGIIIYFVSLRLIKKQILVDIKNLYREFRPEWFSLSFIKSKFIKNEKT